MYKILIVDDTHAWCEFHKTNIEELFLEKGIQGVNNYSIDTAESARIGLDRLYENSSSPYDLIISDLQMEEDFAPKYAGEWFVEQTKNLSAYMNTKIIISSGCYNIKNIANSLGVDYMPKRIACTDINAYKDLVSKLLKLGEVK